MGSETHTLLVQWVADSSSKVRWPECEDDYSLLFDGNVKRVWSYTSTALYIFIM
jgi:hypothetical protein